MPDEVGTWAIAHYLGNQVPIQMTDNPPYPLGMGVLLAPITAVFADGGDQYRAFLVISAVLVAASALGYVAAVRQFFQPAATVTRVAVLALALLLPSVTFSSSFSWAEPLVFAYWSLFLVTLAVVWRTNTPAMFAVGGVVVGAANFVHSRLLAVPVVWLIMIGIVFAAGQRGSSPSLSKRSLACAVASTVVTFVMLMIVYRMTLSAVWTDPSVESPFDLWRVMDRALFWTSLVRVGAGQLWYVVTSSAGLAAVGVLNLIGLARRRGWEGVVGRTLLLAVASNLVISITFFSTSFARGGYQRYDHLIYGRYNDGATVALSIFGVVWLFNAARRKDWRPYVAVVWATIVPLAIAAQFALESLPLQSVFEPTVSGVWVWPTVSSGVDVIGWTGAWLIVTVLFAIGIRLGAGPLLVIMIAVLFLSAELATDRVLYVHNKWRFEALHREVPDPVGSRDIVVVAADLASDHAFRGLFLGQQFFLTAQGWRYEISQLSTIDLVDRPPSDAGVLLVTADWKPGEANRGMRPIGVVGPAAVLLLEGGELVPSRR